MTMTVFDRVQAILMKKYSLERERITPDSTLESLGLDSLDLIELLFEVEDEFNIRVPQEGGAALKAATVQDIVDSIEKLVSQEGEASVAGGL
jgi:acyl carrier protein